MSRTRKDATSKKKRAKRRSYSSESSEQSPRVRKRKGSKRKRDYEAKKKTYSKKKPKRDDSVSSLSRRSWSCSICQTDSISRHEVEFKRHRSKRAREERNFEKIESVKKRSRYGSRTSSSFSQCSESSTYQSNEKVLVENNSRRLKSVIMVAERDNEDRELNNDEHKEEMIFNHDDYPSCRSNDSIDVGSKRGEGDHISHVDSGKIRLENEKGDDTAVSDFRFTKLEDSGKISGGDDGGQFDGNNPSSEEFGMANLVNETTTEVFGAFSSLNGDDLESVLRQRALENLRKFHGGLQFSGKTAVKDKSDGDGKAKHLSTNKAESHQIGLTEQYGTRVVGVNSSKEDRTEVFISTETQSEKRVRIPPVRKGPTYSSEIDENIIDRNPGGNESVSARQNITCSTDEMAISVNPKQKVNTGTSIVRPKLAKPALTRQLSKTDSGLKQAPECEGSGAKLLVTENTFERTAAITAPTVRQNSNNDVTDINNMCSSPAFVPTSPKSTSGDTKSDKLQDEVKEGSQFEQKTMSVIRGGEMVQVGDFAYHIF